MLCRCCSFVSRCFCSNLIQKARRRLWNMKHRGRASCKDSACLNILNHFELILLNIHCNLYQPMMFLDVFRFLNLLNLLLWKGHHSIKQDYLSSFPLLGSIGFWCYRGAGLSDKGVGSKILTTDPQYNMKLNNEGAWDPYLSSFLLHFVSVQYASFLRVCRDFVFIYRSKWRWQK